MKTIRIDDKIIGDNNPCYIIAEIGGGLFQNFNEAKRLIDSSIEIGIDAIKFQTYKADTVTTKNNFFNMEATGKVSQYELLKKCELSDELQIKVTNYAKDCGITVFSAPSHMNDLELMKKMDFSVYKIGSDLACHIPLLKKVAELQIPIILSTGMCDMEEVKLSVETILDTGNDQLALMHCVSDYPTKIEETNLNAILTMKKEFGLPVGMSDHCIGTTTTFASVVMGANLIERHLRDIQNTPSPDDIHSLTKQEFSKLIHSIKDFEKARGTGIKVPTKSEKKNLEKNRVSIIAMEEIPKGSVIQENMIDIRRPGTGIQPIDFWKVIGKKTTTNIQKEEPIKWNFLE